MKVKDTDPFPLLVALVEGRLCPAKKQRLRQVLIEKPDYTPILKGLIRMRARIPKNTSLQGYIEEQKTICWGRLNNNSPQAISDTNNNFLLGGKINDENCTNQRD